MMIALAQGWELVSAAYLVGAVALTLWLAGPANRGKR